MTISNESYLSAVARMHARQESWSRVARSQSSDSDVSGGSSSPLQTGMTPIRPGPSEASGSTSSRADTGTGASGRPAPAGIGKTKEKGDRRKKVAKACLACQKSHLTCDEQRPCTRCVKKGIGQQCVEGVRKKAKYLLEGEERDALQVQHPSPPSSYRAPSNPPAPLPMPIPIPVATSAPARSSTAPDDIWLAPPMATTADDSGLGTSIPGLDDAKLWGTGFSGVGTGNPFDFSTTASSEYHMLDQMLSALSPIYPGLDLGTDLPMDSFSAQSSHPTTFPTQGSAPAQIGGPIMDLAHAQVEHGSAPALVSPNWPISGVASSTPDVVDSAGLSPWSAWTRDGTAGPATIGSGGVASARGPVVTGGDSGGAIGMGNGNGMDNGVGNGFPASVGGMSPPVAPVGRMPKSAADVHYAVIKPYDYTEGYHYLMEFLAKNFEQKDVLRVVKALASFRPSLIALQMPMSEEDEVFLERSFQRTLIELEKLISYSATPTAVWRRTGEVVYANPEFCSLVGRQGTELMGGRTYIYRLFTKSSVIAYWENFSVHAFENTTQNFFMPSTVTVGEKQVACSCCFTIRRDVFDLPSVVIGQFLPIPLELRS